ncbi:hypothetical protein [Clostridium botulinum]|nr:hypothetical protein [Clostridium botulinum]
MKLCINTKPARVKKLGKSIVGRLGNINDCEEFVYWEINTVVD